MDFPDPVIKVAIEPKTKADIDKMANGLIKLAQEDPSFHFSHNEDINQTIIEGMGELHLEIIVYRLKREFKCIWSAAQFCALVDGSLVDGSYQDVDSSVLAFHHAAIGAFHEGMKKAGPKMLEPIMKVNVIAPEEHLGEVIGDLNSRRGQINNFGDKPGGLKLAKFDVVPQHIQNQLAASKEEAVSA